MYDFGKQPDPKRNQQSRAQGPRNAEQQRQEQKQRDLEKGGLAQEARARWEAVVASLPEGAAQVEAAHAAGIEPDLWQIYGMRPPAEVLFRQQMRIASAKADEKARFRADLQKNDPEAYTRLLEQERAQAEAGHRAAYEEGKNGFASAPPKRLPQPPVDTKATEKARQRAEDKANGIIHPSDPDAVIHYISPEEAVLSPQERAQAVQKGIMPPLFAELREWADNMRAHPEVPMEELYPKSAAPTEAPTSLSPTAQPPQEPVQLAQAIPMGPALPAPPLPGVPFPANQWPFPNIFRNKNPLTGQPTQTEEERKALGNLTPDQIKGLQKSPLKDDVQYASHSFKQNQCTFIDVGVGNGGPVHNMMVEAMTGAQNPTVVVTPTGDTALFDGQYRGDLARLNKRKGQLFEVESLTPPTTAAQKGIAQSFIQSKLPEWERQAAIAHSCGTSLRVALPDTELAAWANQQLKVKTPGLAITEGHWGGTYGQVRADTVGGEVHHTPANEVTPFSTAKGPAIWMDIRHHKKTGSNGKGKEQVRYRERQRDLIQQGKVMNAILKDVQDINEIAPEIYDIPVRQMLKTYIRNQKNGTYKK